MNLGTDTTSVAVTYIAWALACNHTFSYEIRRELANIPEQKRSDIDVLKALPYLNAFIRVSLSLLFSQGTPLIPNKRKFCASTGRHPAF